MKHIKLIHWKAEEVSSREQLINAAGYQVDSKLGSGTTMMKQLANNPPTAIVIDLSRLPSQGRDLALMIRKNRGTRIIPIVFVGGNEDKVEQIKLLIPDATYTFWEDIQPALEMAILKPPSDPIVPDSIFAGYAGKTLPEKLGIKSDTSICLVNAPSDFMPTLGQLPQGVKTISDCMMPCDLTIWFCESKADLERDIEIIINQSNAGPIWIAWPKQKSSLESDLTQQYVRQVGLANQLVDYKICAIDETWSGLLFRNRE